MLIIENMSKTPNSQSVFFHYCAYKRTVVSGGLAMSKGEVMLLDSMIF